MISFFFYFLLFLFGTSIGSFLNCVIYRSFEKRSLFGRSFCPHCKRYLEIKDLIPILSFILLGGKCRYCRGPISLQYPLVEFSSGILLPFTIYFLFHLSPISLDLGNLIFGSVFFQFWFLLFLFSLFFILFSFIVFFVSDIKYLAIPQNLAFFSLFFAFFYQFLGEKVFPEDFELKKTLIFSFAVALFFSLLVFLTKEKGMGKGDILLSTTVSLFLGKEIGPLAIYFSILLGAIFSLILILLGKKTLKSKIPFGPFLIISAFSFFFFEDFLVLPFIKFFDYFIQIPFQDLI